MPDDRPESPEERTEQQRENLRGWADRLREAGDELQRHAGRANDGTTASMPETNRLGRLVNTCRLIASHLDSEAACGQDPQPSSHGDYGCADGSHGVRAALSTPAGPRCQTCKDVGEVLRVPEGHFSNRDTGNDTTTCPHCSAPSPREEAVEALRELVRLKDGPRDDAYRRDKEAAWQRARVALSAARPSSPTPEETPDHVLAAMAKAANEVGDVLAPKTTNAGQMRAALDAFWATTKEGR